MAKQAPRKMSIDSEITMIEIMQYAKYGFDNLKAAKICEALDVQGFLDKYAYINHKSDVKYDDKTHQPVLDDNGDTVPRDPHTHLLIRFSHKIRVSKLLNICKVVCGTTTKPDTEEQVDVIRFVHLERIKAGWMNAITYLTHENTPWKHIYDRHEVVSNYDFAKDIDSCLAVIDEEAFETKLREAILSCECRRFQIADQFKGREMFYPRFEKKVDSYFKLRDLQQRDFDRDVDVIFIYGPSGTGKSTFAKEYCKKLGYSYVTEGGGNDPLENYQEQDAFIYSEFRGNGWSQRDLLSFLDNNTSSLQKSRYHNKNFKFCKLIILCSSRPLDEIWENTSDFDNNEQRKQLKRRIGTCIDLTKELMVIHHFSDGVEFCNPEFCPNPVSNMFKDTKPKKLDFSAWGAAEVSRVETINGDTYVYAETQKGA